MPPCHLSMHVLHINETRPHPPSLSLTHIKMGGGKKAQGKVLESVQSFNKTLFSLKKCPEMHPGHN